MSCSRTFNGFRSYFQVFNAFWVDLVLAGVHGVLRTCNKETWSLCSDFDQTSLKKECFFHCLKCNLCLAVNLQGKHKCIENVSRQDCPICLEDIHTSRVVAHVLPCGHLLHRTCYEEMVKEGYRCPLCMHSAFDMSRYWRQLDDEVAQTPMPSEYQNMTVDILCNDCNGRSTVQFHIVGIKCNICESYNTAQAGGCRISIDQQWTAYITLEKSGFSDRKRLSFCHNASQSRH